MGTLVFECPRTHRSFKSDIHTDPDSLDKVRHLRARVRCPICDEVHELNVKHSHVEDDFGRDQKPRERSDG